MKKAETYYLVAKGGYLKKPIIEKFEVTPEEVAEIVDEDDGLGLQEEDAIEEILSEKSAEYEQGWSKVIIFTEKEFQMVKKMFTKF